MGGRALFGRDVEIARLEAALADAREGRGGVALITGPAGIGKSAVAERLVASATERGVEVLSGRAWEFADAPPYFPLSSCLRTLGVDPRASSAAFALWEDVLMALAKRSSTRPIVIAIEDLHASDLLTLDLLVFLAQSVRTLRVLILVTLRDQDPRIDLRARSRLDRLGRDGLRVPLATLGKEEIAKIAEGCVDRALSSVELARLTERSEGNPLFVVELARALADPRGTETSPLPPTLRQLVLERLDRLPAACRSAVVAGAVLGREVRAGLVARMLDTLPARIVDDLRPALDAGLLIEARPGTFFFSHVLERDAVEDSLGAEERARLHAAAERALAVVDETPETMVERARHALEGLGFVAPDDAVALLTRAVGALEAEGAYDRAFALWWRLEDARRSGTVAVEQSTPERLSRVRLARLAGRHTDGRVLCEEAVAVARAAGDIGALTDAVLTLGAELQPGFIDSSLVRLLEDAAKVASPGHPLLVARLEARLAAALQPAVDPQGPVAMARRVMAVATTSPDDAYAVEVLENAGSAMVDYAPIAERMACASELLVRARRLGDHARELRALGRRAMDLAELPDLPAFSATVDEMLTISFELGHPRFRYRPLLFASMRACMYGRFDESERHLVEIDQLAALTDERALATGLAAHRLMRVLDVGTPEELRAAAAQTPALFRGAPHGVVLGALMAATCQVRTGDHDEVRRALATLDSIPDGFVFGDIGFPATIAEAASACGSQKLLLRMREFWDAMGDRDCPLGHITHGYVGPASRLRGLISAGLGDLGRAEDQLSRALDSVRARGLPPFVARVGCELGNVLVRRGRHAEANALFEEAARIADDIGLRNLPLPASVHTEAASHATVHGTPARLTFRRSGDAWVVSDGHREARVRDVRGLHLLARLAEHAGEEIHVLALASDEGVALPESHAGDALDERAKRAYRERLRALASEIEEAEAANDVGARARLERERAILDRELRGALGLGGDARKAGSLAERARVNVQRRLKDAVGRIREVDPALGATVGLALRTGTYCCLRLSGGN